MEKHTYATTNDRAYTLITANPLAKHKVFFPLALKATAAEKRG
jgi:hypothetical protein